MDLLDRVIRPGSDLLSQVDVVLSRFGAPADHPVWGEISRAGALPSVALVEIATLAPAEIQAVAAGLISTASGIRDSAESVPARLESRGTAADGFSAAWRGLAAQITGPGAGSVADRITETAAVLDEIADWALAARRDLAGELGACLGSAEAVLLRSAGGNADADAIRAAADIAMAVLGSINRSVADGWRCAERCRDVAAEMSVTAAAAAADPLPNHIELR